MHLRTDWNSDRRTSDISSDSELSTKVCSVNVAKHTHSATHKFSLRLCAHLAHNPEHYHWFRRRVMNSVEEAWYRCRCPHQRASSSTYHMHRMAAEKLITETLSTTQFVFSLFISFSTVFPRGVLGMKHGTS